MWIRSDQYDADRSSASSPMCVSLPDVEARPLDEVSDLTDGGAISSDGSFFDLEKTPATTGSYYSYPAT